MFGLEWKDVVGGERLAVIVSALLTIAAFAPQTCSFVSSALGIGGMRISDRGAFGLSLLAAGVLAYNANGLIAIYYGPAPIQLTISTFGGIAILLGLYQIIVTWRGAHAGYSRRFGLAYAAAVGAMVAAGAAMARLFGV